MIGRSRGSAHSEGERASHGRGERSGVAFERSIADRFTREPSTPLRHRIGDRAQNIRADQRRRSTEVTPGHQDALKREVLNSTDFGIHPCIGHPDAINREVLKYGTYLHTSLIA